MFGKLPKEVRQDPPKSSPGTDKYVQGERRRTGSTPTGMFMGPVEVIGEPKWDPFRMSGDVRWTSETNLKARLSNYFSNYFGTNFGLTAKLLSF